MFYVYAILTADFEFIIGIELLDFQHEKHSTIKIKTAHTHTLTETG